MSTHWNIRYRPRTVAAIHLESVRKTIQGLVSAPQFPHVFLFAGPKGTGKTSVSRIIGAIVNEPKNEKSIRAKLFGQSIKNAPDLEDATVNSQSEAIFSGESFLVSELDAASNRGIDDVRYLKEQAAVGPIGGLVSVYILDEVHMLTTEAFNALLKLLEEPPPHAIFILATTELHKIPDTIVSRCQVILFHKASQREILHSLTHIVAAEKLSISDEELQTIALVADGSFRDAVKYLELHNNLAGSTLTEALHMPTATLCWELLSAVVDKNETQVLTILGEARTTGINEQYLIKMLVLLLHDDILAQYGLIDAKPHFSERVALFLLQALSNPDLLKPSPLPHLRLELALLELISRAKQQSSSGSNTLTKTRSSATTSTKSVKKASVSKKVNDSTPDHSLHIEELVDKSTVTNSSTENDLSIELDTIPSITTSSADTIVQQLGDGTRVVDNWQEVIAKVAQHNFSLAALLRSATPIEGSLGKTTIKVYYSFHKDQLLQPKWLALLQELLVELAGGFIQLHCVVEAHQDSELLEPKAVQPLERLAVEALL